MDDVEGDQALKGFRSRWMEPAKPPSEACGDQAEKVASDYI